MTVSFTFGTETKTYTELRSAKRAANKILDGNNGCIQIVDDENLVVATVLTSVKDRRFFPGERVEQPKTVAPSIPGFIPAYTRKRIGATAYRGIEKGSGWAVHDLRTGGIVFTKDTIETRKLFTAMRKGKMLEVASV